MGGVYIMNNAIVDLNLCVVNNCRATATEHGGVAILVDSSTVNIWGTSFTGNTAASGDGNDIKLGVLDPS